MRGFEVLVRIPRYKIKFNRIYRGLSVYSYLHAMPCLPCTVSIATYRGKYLSGHAWCKLNRTDGQLAAWVFDVRTTSWTYVYDLDLPDVFYLRVGSHAVTLSESGGVVRITRIEVLQGNNICNMWRRGSPWCKPWSRVEANKWQIFYTPEQHQRLYTSFGWCLLPLSLLTWWPTAIACWPSEGEQLTFHSVRYDLVYTR